ncbi:hypothetical protein [Terriglobus sp. TAA 43]|uniref:hypothetical protein n=1 Tax=Terriglobus sp. TAA 43 TaxID=278961 RepID=UPI00068B92C7|nr:hypothetical protein [Terriglobus sp. TAA 43]
MLARFRFACTAFALLFAALPSHGQEGPYNVRVVLRAETKGQPTVLQPADVRVQFAGKKVPVQRLEPLISNRTTKPLQVAILIDDGLRGSFGSQVSDIRQFAADLAAQHVSVGVAYMQNGRAVFGEGGFTSDPEVVAKQLRLSMGGAGISASPYFCLQDLIKNWPGDRTAPRAVLMITNGIDLYNGAPTPNNQYSPYVQSAIQDAQRAGVPVYSIYYGRFDNHPGYASFSGQSYLGDLADSTGANTFNQGSLNPPSISPYLKQFEKNLNESWLLSFQTGTRKLEPLKVDGAKGTKLYVQRMAQGNDATAAVLR